MAVQTYHVGVFFLVGIVSGIVVTYAVTSFMQPVTFNPVGTMLPRSDFPEGSVTDTPPRNFAQSNSSAVDYYRPPMSHEEIDRMPVPEKVMEFKDDIHHKGEDHYFFPSSGPSIVLPLS